MKTLKLFLRTIACLVLAATCFISCNNNLFQNNGISLQLPSISRNETFSTGGSSEQTGQTQQNIKFDIIVFNDFYTYNETGKPNEKIFINNIITGTYTVTVNALDSNGNIILTGSDTVIIENQKISKVKIQLHPVSQTTTEEPKTNDTTYQFHTTITSVPEDDGYVYFGDWPQQILPNDGSVTFTNGNSITVGGNTYYLGDDGFYYIQIREKAYGSYTYSDRTQTQYSSTNSTRYFKVEPIKWKVLTTEGNKKLLLSDKILMSGVHFYYSADAATYDETSYKPNDYSESQIRAYLNGISYTDKDNQTNETYLNKGFLQSAFKDATRIQFTTVNTPSVENFPNSSLYTSKETNDKIFILSFGEASNTDYGFKAYPTTEGNNSDQARAKTATDYALANGYLNNDKWWLRTAATSYTTAAAVTNTGTIGSAITESCSKTNVGIVPALWVSE